MEDCTFRGYVRNFTYLCNWTLGYIGAPIRITAQYHLPTSLKEATLSSGMSTVLKTKDLMIEVARQLFARVGFTNTTMNDIADASNKGRRTLYTYFRNKDEIFHAVIERELDRLWHDLELVRRLTLSPEEKIMTMMLTHLYKMKDLVLRNGSLRAEFFRDISLVEQVRSDFDRKEVQQFEDILDAGNRVGILQIPNARLMAYLLQNMVKGMEVPFISGAYRIYGTIEEIRAVVRHLLLHGLDPRHELQPTASTPLDSNQ